MVGPQDYIHTRVLLGCFEDLRTIIAKGLANLKPGGWMESQEYYPTVYCDDGTMPPEYPFAEWTRAWDSAAMHLGKPLRIGNKLKKWYEQAGFVDVHEEIFRIPINAWAKDPWFKLLGKFSERNLHDGLQAFSLQLFTQGLGWKPAEIEVYLARVRAALADRSVHGYHKV